VHEALGEIALAENKSAEAIVEFRRADVLPDGPATACPICLPVNLARAFDAAHQSDSAIVMYEKYISTPYLERLDPPLFVQFVDPVDPIFLAGVHHRLGELHEAKGDTAKAVEHYGAFVELWKNADPELQPRVAEARRRLQALTPVEKVKRGS
jgi:eukaryotic-like serine/threonine-protein kinase